MNKTNLVMLGWLGGVVSTVFAAGVIVWLDPKLWYCMISRDGLNVWCF